VAHHARASAVERAMILADDLPPAARTVYDIGTNQCCAPGSQPGVFFGERAHQAAFGLRAAMRVASHAMTSLRLHAIRPLTAWGSPILIRRGNRPRRSSRHRVAGCSRVSSLHSGSRIRSGCAGTAAPQVAASVRASLQEMNA
jgi:hypothetical protein